MKPKQACWAELAEASLAGCESGESTRTITSTIANTPDFSPAVMVIENRRNAAAGSGVNVSLESVEEISVPTIPRVGAN